MTATRDDLQSLHEVVARYYRGHPTRRDRLATFLREALDTAVKPPPFAFADAGEHGWFLGRPGSARCYVPPRPLRFLKLARVAIEYGALISFADLREIDGGSMRKSALCSARAAAAEWIASLPDCALLATAIERVHVTRFGLQYEAAAGACCFITT